MCSLFRRRTSGRPLRRALNISLDTMAMVKLLVKYNPHETSAIHLRCQIMEFNANDENVFQSSTKSFNNVPIFNRHLQSVNS